MLRYQHDKYVRPGALSTIYVPIASDSLRCITNKKTQVHERHQAPHLSHPIDCTLFVVRLTERPVGCPAQPSSSTIYPASRGGRPVRLPLCNASLIVISSYIHISGRHIVNLKSHARSEKGEATRKARKAQQARTWIPVYLAII